jgi:hypothetical protein
VYTLVLTISSISIVGQASFSERSSAARLVVCRQQIPLRQPLKIRAGYDIAFQCFQDTPMVLMLSVDPSRQPDLLTEHRIELLVGITSHDYLMRLATPARGLSRLRVCWKSATTSSSATVVSRTRSFPMRSNGTSALCRMRHSLVRWSLGMVYRVAGQKLNMGEGKIISEGERDQFLAIPSRNSRLGKPAVIASP